MKIKSDISEEHEPSPLYQTTRLGPSSMSSKAMDALNQMGKDDVFAAFKACCGSTKYAQVPGWLYLTSK
jgi:hypothetical protein